VKPSEQKYKKGWATNSFANLLVTWQRHSGRHDLPWQKDLDPYKVWVSEIMLQQTQVSTVITYFERFMRQFPTVQTLASASQDEVLGLWSGLGYYSRARNLHCCAQQIVELHASVFPKDYETLQTLPGIGPSTAAAIASICFKQRVPILDGNVKRVLSRLRGFGADLSLSKSNKDLLTIAFEELPQSKSDMPTYTQGVMDLGATLCTPKNPKCGVCPVSMHCIGYKSGEPNKYPVKTKRVKKRAESMWLVCLVSKDGRVLLQRRPAKGIWAALYCFPMFSSEELCEEFIGSLGAKQIEYGAAFTHVLTHKELSLHVVQIRSFNPESLRAALQKIPEMDSHWLSRAEWSVAGLPAPIRKTLLSL
jgi:A/G-specific adenine glycosylase